MVSSPPLSCEFYQTNPKQKKAIFLQFMLQQNLSHTKSLEKVFMIKYL